MYPIIIPLIFYPLILWSIFITFRFIWKMIKYAKKIELQLTGPPIPWNRWFWCGNLEIVFKKSDNSIDFVEEALNLLETATRFFPEDSPRYWLAVFPFVLVHRADHAKLILSGSVHINKARQYDMLKPWLNESLITSGDSKWHQRRKLLTPTFHFNILEEFIPIMNEQSKILVDLIGSFDDHQEFLDANLLMTNATFSIITETAMGIKMDVQRDGKYQEFVKTLARIEHIAFKRLIFPWLQNNFIYFNLIPEGWRHRRDLDMVHKFSMDVIHKRKAEMIREKSDKQDSMAERPRRRRLAFLDLLLEVHLANPEKFTETDIQEEVDAFMFAGHETTATSLTWTLYLLGNHPEIQERVHEEIDSILSPDEPFNGWTANQLRQMKLLEACIKESLRIYPPVPLIGRVSGEEIPLDNGRIIPKDITILIFLARIHRDPKYFDKPEFFIPDRFLQKNDEDDRSINPFAYIPFSAGPRNCIGQKFAIQEEKIILATILHRYRIRSRLPINAIRTHTEITLRPKDPVHIRFEPRQKS